MSKDVKSVMAPGTPGGPAKEKGKLKLHRLEIEPLEGGGHIVTHNMRSSNGDYVVGPDPKHVFGPDDRAKLIAHINKHI
jgi:hypothetical protein